MARFPVFAVFGASVITGAVDARAMTCASEPHVRVLPSSEVPAPRNTHVRVRLRRGHVGEDDEAIPCVPAQCDAPGFGFSLRPAGAKAQSLAFTETKIVAGETTTFELVPNQSLAASARFEVWRTDGQGRDVGLLSSFTTSAVLDEHAPDFPVWDEVRFHPYPPRLQRSKKPGKVFVLDLFEQRSPWIGVRGPRPTDDVTRVGDLAYFVWSVPDGARIDYTRPPDAILGTAGTFLSMMSPDHLFDWGSEGTCFLDTLSTPYPRGKRQLGVRVVDLAGNRSAPQERVVDFDK